MSPEIERDGHRRSLVQVTLIVGLLIITVVWLASGIKSGPIDIGTNRVEIGEAPTANYDELARNPTIHSGGRICISGEIWNIKEQDDGLCFNSA